MNVEGKEEEEDQKTDDWLRFRIIRGLPVACVGDVKDPSGDLGQGRPTLKSGEEGEEDRL